MSREILKNAEKAMFSEARVASDTGNTWVAQNDGVKNWP